MHMSQENMDDELKETPERLDRIKQIMYQEAQGSWRYECPMKKNVKWPIE
jgi:Spy/CpxP family protein refolding chaperone